MWSCVTATLLSIGSMYARARSTLISPPAFSDARSAAAIPPLPALRVILTITAGSASRVCTPFWPVRRLGNVEWVPEGRPRAGIRFLYFRTPWGLHMELVDRTHCRPS